MRPTTGTMLQQNNNNNYPCLNMSGSTRDMLQKCSKASLPFPGRMELGLGDLPLIRELRAWALCSKNRRKAGGLLGGGQAPIVAGRAGATHCYRPADVCLSGEWGRMGYGLPLGLDGGQAGIGALVTVASLKTSEGGGKTQTQCLFLRTEKGSCLYSTAKPGSSAASSVVGGWLRGKARSRDTPAGRRDNGQTPPAQTGANRVRVRSGRRWRKSCNAAGREKAGVSRELQGRNPAGEIILEERQEDGDKGGLDLKQTPSPEQDDRRACRSHHESPKTCSQCGQRSQDGDEGGESPRGGLPNRLNAETKGMRKRRQKNEEEEEEETNPDPESKLDNPGPLSVCEAEEIREAERKEEETDSEDLKGQTTDTDEFSLRLTRDQDETNTGETLCGDKDIHVNGSVDKPEDLKAESRPEDLKERERSSREVSVSTCPPQPSSPVEGSTTNAEHKACVWWEKEKKEEDHIEETPQGEAGPGITVQEALQEESCAVEEDRKPPPFSEDGANKEESEKEEKDKEKRAEEVWRNEGDLDQVYEEDDERREDEEGEGGRECAPKDNMRLEESADGRRWRENEGGDTCRQTNITRVEADGESRSNVINAPCADPSTSITLLLANPAPSLPPLGSMATGLPCLEAEKEEEEEEEESEEVKVTVEDGEGGQDGKRELEEVRGSTVATEEDRKEEEEEEEEEDEFGVFMQAEGEPAWSEGPSMSASVPCGSRGSVAALGNHAVSPESTHWTSGWTDSSFCQSDDTWAAFPQDASDDGGDAAVGQWWPRSAVEQSKDRLLANQNLASVFAQAFPSPPALSSSDLDTVPTLTQILRGGRADQGQGLLDSFHDLNKMICQRNKRANGASRDLLLKTLHLVQPQTEVRPAPRTANRRLSPGLPSANQHAQNAAAKRRLSYDYNRNIME
ncbi:eukaryotic translation initiation factor 5B [Xyrichtys novacula]|uniref:Eukaryotic translation initiation factor 5B n=1 Tax=Xyrichtys novacula TaxID=13765 RepID=A0AAV1FVB0_XYRNO|nr:eukaryotic translation initiation factor 5B [Xyrichtys novacula]